jgi:hypothetical protein
MMRTPCHVWNETAVRVDSVAFKRPWQFSEASLRDLGAIEQYCPVMMLFSFRRNCFYSNI